MTGSDPSPSAADRDVLIFGGRLVDPGEGIDRQADLVIRAGVVAAIDPDPRTVSNVRTRIDASGKIVAPGFVDLGVEVREPGHEEDETIESASAAALAGGYTSVLACSNTSPCIDSRGGVEFVRQKAARTDGVRMYVIGCLSKERRGEQMAELGLLFDAGAVAFSDAPRPIGNDALMKRALDYARMFNRPVFNRPNVRELSEGGVMHDGQVSLVLGLKGLPTEAEDLAVARDVRLAEATGGRLHVGPVSTMGAIDLLRRVKGRGIGVTASACPHNICLSDAKLRTFDSRYKVHPPLRSPRHVEMMIEAIADGTIDAIQSGHMPRAPEKKMNDLDEAPFGGASLETCLATVVTYLIDPGHLDWSTAIERMSTAPARIAGVPGGSLSIGVAADVIVIDPAAKQPVDASQFRSHCRSSPLDGETLSGRVTHTLVGGTVKYAAYGA